MRCAIYTRMPPVGPGAAGRPSQEDQRRVCEGYVAQQPRWELLAEPFDDHGFSGANLDRPALQCLLGQIDTRCVDVVVVQRADVLSRWYLDFVALMERMSARGVGFVAVSEGFSTVSPAGRSTLRLLLSFAELQRAATLPERAATTPAGWRRR